MCCGAGGGGLIHRLGLFLWVRNFEFYYFWGFWEKVAIIFFSRGVGEGRCDIGYLQVFFFFGGGGWGWGGPFQN